MIAGIVLIFVMNVLANAGGIGGGGIMTPFMMLFMNLPITECIPLSNSFALISAITRFVLNYQLTHPYRPWRKIIDYEVVTVTMPLVYLGTIIGVLIGAQMNSYMLMGLLAIVLMYTFYVTIKKGFEEWKKETKKKTLGEALIHERERKRTLKLSRIAHSISRVVDKPLSKDLQRIVKEEGQHFTKKRIMTIIGTFTLLFITLFLMSAQLFESKFYNQISQIASLAIFMIYTFYATVKSTKEV